MELIQYQPVTDKVKSIPLLIVPPWINKYYILDLSPENSLVKWLTEQGITVFIISWVNPDESHANKSFFDYLHEGPETAIELIQKQMNVEHRKEVVSSQSSMLAEKIKSLRASLKRKMHDDGQLYGSVNRSEIVELLKKYSISVAKNQIIIPKQIKSKGTFDVTVKLSSKLQPTMKLTVVSE